MNNTIGTVILCMLVFLLALVGGKWIVDSLKEQHHQSFHERNNSIPNPPVIVQPQVILKQEYPQVFPQYHNDNNFWFGYSDGWHGFLPRQNNLKYNQGYTIGVHDRKCNNPHYYQRYYPPGFHLRLPGFQYYWSFN